LEKVARALFRLQLRPLAAASQLFANIRAVFVEQRRRSHALSAIAFELNRRPDGM
jgi:hypothetical protein